MGGDCQPCPEGRISDANGECQVCSVGEVVGNSCNQCQADLVIDGATRALEGDLDVTAQPADDNCPDTFWVEITNPTALWARDIDSFGANVSPYPANAQSCTGPWSLIKGFPDPATGYYTEDVASGTGGFTPCPPDAELCLPLCTSLPGQTLTETESSASVVRFGTPVRPEVRLRYSGSKDSDPPK